MRSYRSAFAFAIFFPFTLYVIALSSCKAVPSAASKQEERKSSSSKEGIKPSGAPVDMMFIDSENGWILYRESLWRLSNKGLDRKMQKVLTRIGEPETNSVFVGLFCVNEQVLFLNLSDQVLKTTDGGESWVPVLEAKGIESFNNVFFHDLHNGWVVGDKHDQPFPAAILLHTNDGGQTWQEMSSLLTDQRKPSYGVELSTIKFLDNGVGWISGDGSLWKTRDWGKTWEQFVLTISGETNIRLSRMELFDEMNGYAHYGPAHGAVAHYLVKTTDGGQSWQSLKAPIAKAPIGLVDFQFLNINHGFAIFQDDLFETVDGGMHWKNIKIENVTGNHLLHLEKIFFVNDKSGWIAGRNGLLISTNDSGRTWLAVHKAQE